MSASPVSNVSDTARWVAVYRAWESTRPDALFRDPYAERLAGERGRAMTTIMPQQAHNGWPIIVRTKVIDDLILTGVAEGCDCVVNLAAGLDSRPYRMARPPALRWVEVDLPAMIEEKHHVLAADHPICQLSRRPVDITDAAARTALLDELAASALNILVICEGLLMYLDESVVSDLARDLHARPVVRWWICDLASPRVTTMMTQRLTNAPMKFAPRNGVAFFFEALGWAPGHPPRIPRSRALSPPAERTRDPALFNLAVDSKLRSCDLVKLRVRDITHGERVAARAIVIQQKTQRPVQFEITEQTRQTVTAWIAYARLRPDDFLFPSRLYASIHLSTRQYVRIVVHVGMVARVIPTNGGPIPTGYDPSFYGNSVAHWDGDILVVEGENFTTQSWMGPGGYIHSDKMKVEERLWRDGNTLHYQATITDPVVLMTTWVKKPITLLKTNFPIVETPPCVSRTNDPDAVLEQHWLNGRRTQRVQ